MRNKVTVSFTASVETRKILKKMAIDEGKTMAAFLEEMITIRWEQTYTENKNGIIQSFCSTTTDS